MAWSLLIEESKTVRYFFRKFYRKRKWASSVYILNKISEEYSKTRFYKHSMKISDAFHYRYEPFRLWYNNYIKLPRILRFRSNTLGYIMTFFACYMLLGITRTVMRQGFPNKQRF